jgi:outer membrane protein assembly factor BamB
VYLVDSASLGGADHATALAKSPQFSRGAAGAGGIATFEDNDGTRWILVSSLGPVSGDAASGTSNSSVTNGAIAAFKVVDQGGAPALQPAWTSRDLIAPATPAIVNGVVFALSTGENVQVPAAQRAQRSSNAILYALDLTTGKELWNSGTSIAAAVHGVGPAVDDSQVYVAGSDGTLYAFGFVIDR